jgi:DNA-binding beta-propeller fold protein YncE
LVVLDNNNVRTIANGTMSTLSGARTSFASFVGRNDGFSSYFNLPRGAAYEADGSLLIADTNNHLIRRVLPSGYALAVAGTGAQGTTDDFGLLASLSLPYGITVDSQTGTAYFTDSGSSRIRAMTAAYAVSTIAGSAAGTPVDGIGTAAVFNVPQGLCFDGNGGLFVADSAANRVRYVNILQRRVTTLIGSTAGTREGPAGFLSAPRAIQVLPGGSSAIIADFANSRIRRLTCSVAPFAEFTTSTNDTAVARPAPPRCTPTLLAGGGTFLNVSGQPGFLDGDGVAALFNAPSGLALDASDGTVIYIADTGNHAVRSLNLSAGGAVATVAGKGAGSSGFINMPWPLLAGFNGPTAVRLRCRE